MWSELSLSQAQCQHGLKQAEHGIHLCLHEDKSMLKKKFLARMLSCRTLSEGQCVRCVERGDLLHCQPVTLATVDLI